MGFRTLEIRRRAELHVTMGQLTIEQEEGKVMMLQPELFMRIGTNRKGIEKHLRRIQDYNPGTGVVRILKLTEKQFKSIIYLTGGEDYQEKTVGNNCCIIL